MASVAGGVEISEEVSGTPRGRFAPTPSGSLHFGSLVAAVGSYLEARRQRGEWLVRMEDLDPPRVVPRAADSILRTLEAFDFEWDGPVLWQSERGQAYQAVFDKLPTYPCACTRALLSLRPCQCSRAYPAGELVRCYRARLPVGITWEDRLRGPQHSVETDAEGDVSVLRADGVFTYQLAVVVDDAEQGVTDVVRGADLLGLTATQIGLQQALGYRTPGYLHLPVATNAQGEKLSKQTRAQPIAERGSARELAAALRFLGQPVPPDCGSLRDVWQWARAEWNPARIPP